LTAAKTHWLLLSQLFKQVSNVVPLYDPTWPPMQLVSLLANVYGANKPSSPSPHVDVSPDSIRSTELRPALPTS
jgi:hypothetical protein